MNGRGSTIIHNSIALPVFRLLGLDSPPAQTTTVDMSWGSWLSSGSGKADKRLLSDRSLVGVGECGQIIDCLSGVNVD